MIWWLLGMFILWDVARNNGRAGIYLYGIAACLAIFGVLTSYPVAIILLMGLEAARGLGVEMYLPIKIRGKEYMLVDTYEYDDEPLALKEHNVDE